MLKRIIHRGPDANGTLIEDGIVLGHNRLAVIDPDRRADQPMESGDGRYIMVYNGEVYNYAELKAELQQQGSSFQTESDSEVVLEAYRAWGVEALARFNGMFALAIWDRKERTLFIARDRLGKKPLFYFQTPNGGFIFASELKALRAHPMVPVEVNPDAIRQYLTLNYLLTSTTILNGVEKLKPGHYALVREGGAFQQQSYWDVADCFRNKAVYRDEREATECLIELLDDAVRLRMISDVPLGALLSGGLDSSAIVASMCRETVAEQVNTFSIGFQERTYSELPWARQVADKLGVTHRDAIQRSDIADEIDRIVYAMDEPFADTSMLPFWLLSRFTRNHVTVALSGDGGDELFCGYETYKADRLHHALSRLPGSISGLAGRLAGSVPVQHNKVGIDYKLRQFAKGLALPDDKAHYSWRTMYENPADIPVLNSDYPSGCDPFSDFERFADDVQGCHYLDRAMYVDLKTWLVDDILVKTDRASMAHSLEVRSPFLDYRVVEFAASLPVEFKLRRFESKYLLKRSQQGRLPENIISRNKSGFNAPVSHWIKGGLKSRLFDAVDSNKVRDILNRAHIEKLFHEHEAGLADHGFRLFGLLCLGVWLESV